MYEKLNESQMSRNSEKKFSDEIFKNNDQDEDLTIFDFTNFKGKLEGLALFLGLH